MPRLVVLSSLRPELISPVLGALQETQLATTFAQDDMSRFGTLFAPSDSAIENAYQQAMDRGANHSEWLDWASKVHLSHPAPVGHNSAFSSCRLL